MTIIAGAAELDALPVGAQILDKDGWKWLKQQSGGWQPIENNSASPSKRVFGLWSPLTLVEQPVLHMTKCVHDACTTTTPLPSGSSWVCGNHNIRWGTDA